MIFNNPAGAPELACDACGCRWFDRQTDTCYQCGEPVPAEQKAAFAAALQAFATRHDARAGNASAAAEARSQGGDTAAGGTGTGN